MIQTWSPANRDRKPAIAIARGSRDMRPDALTRGLTEHEKRVTAPAGHPFGVEPPARRRTPQPCAHAAAPRPTPGHIGDVPARSTRAVLTSRTWRRNPAVHHHRSRPDHLASGRNRRFALRSNRQHPRAARGHRHTARHDAPRTPCHQAPHESRRPQRTTNQRTRIRQLPPDISRLGRTDCGQILSQNTRFALSRGSEKQNTPPRASTRGQPRP